VTDTPVGSAYENAVWPSARAQVNECEICDGPASRPVPNLTWPRCAQSGMPDQACAKAHRLNGTWHPQEGQHSAGA